MSERKSVSNRTLIGGGIVLAAAGGILSLISGFFGGFGSGEGSGEGKGDVQISVDQSTIQPQSPPPAAELEVEGVMDIVIDKTDYLILKPNNQTVKLTLAEIQERAPEISGNSEGVKVRISRKRSSLLSAERDLETALEDAGLDGNQVEWVTSPLD